MKVNVVKDKSGRVIATFEKAQGGGPSVTPELDAGHTVHEIDVAENYRQNIHALYEQQSH
jgi:hypothetical protein